MASKIFGKKIKTILPTEPQEDDEADNSRTPLKKLSFSNLPNHPSVSRKYSISGNDVGAEDKAKFIKWRNEFSMFFSYKCVTLKSDDMERKNTVLVQNIINFPKCMVRITWEFCGCDKNCADDLLSGIDYKSLCSDFDVKNLEDNQVNSDCNFLRLKFTNFAENIILENKFNITRNLKKNFNNICNDENNSIPILRCLGYELNSKCNNDLPCIDSSKLINNVCERKRINSRLENNQTIFYFQGFKYVQKRSLRSISEDYGYESGEINNQNQSLLRINFRNEEYSQSQLNLENNNLLFENIEYKAILYFISTVLVIFSVSGIIVYSIRAIKDKSYTLLTALNVLIITLIILIMCVFD